ncbi:hypothetical protein V1514DRAFT_330380 [Lipomyces japonicus]|uniref:uncharacterized protein n=1 Tax=Lipomyces japonicus TaxID=56871 RepID=UPI0034CD352C
MDHFEVSKRWKVAICTKCKVIVCPKNIISHFKDLHADVNTLHDHDFVRSQEIIEQAKLRPVLQVGPVLDPALRQKITGSYCCNDEPAYFDSALHMIPELPVHDGYQCTHCETFLTSKMVTMRSHKQRNHKDLKLKYKVVKVQKIYGKEVPQRLRLVIVNPRYGSENQELGSGEGEATTFQSAPGFFHSVQETTEDPNRLKNLFGIRFGAYGMIGAGFEPHTMVERFYNPKSVEFKIIMRLCIKLLRHIHGGMVSGFQPLLHRLVFEDKNGEKQFFNEVQEDNTVKTYARHMARAVYLAVQVVRNEMENEAWLKVKMTQEVMSSVENLIAYISTILEHHNEADLHVAEIGQFWFAVAVEKLPLIRISQTVINAEEQKTVKTIPLLAACSNMESLKIDGTFKPYGMISHACGAYLYAMRVAMLWYAAFNDQNENLEQELDKLLTNYYKEGTSSIVRYCVTVVSVARSMSGNDSSFNVTWADNKKKVIQFNDSCMISFDQLVKLTHSLTKEIQQELQDLCFEKVAPLSLTSRHHFDDYTNGDIGYNFMKDHRNNLDHLLVWKSAINDPAIWNNFITQADQIDPKAVSDYHKKASGTLKKLFVLLYFTGGAPPRASEMCTWTFANGPHASRSLLIHPQGAIISSQYSKTRSVTGRNQNVVRMLPIKVGELLLTFLTYVRPVQCNLHYCLNGYQLDKTMADMSTYIFAGPGGVWSNSKARETLPLITADRAELWNPLKVHNARQALVTFLDQKCGMKADLDKSYEEQIVDMQADHSSSTAVSHYALARGDIPGTYKYQLNAYLSFSRKWHEVLQFKTYELGYGGKLIAVSQNQCNNPIDTIVIT